MNTRDKLNQIMTLLRREQAQANESYINTTRYHTLSGSSAEAIDACCILDSLLEEVEKIYNLPKYEVSNFVKNVTNEHAMSPKPPQGF